VHDRRIKLSAEDQEQITERAQNGETQAQIAADFGVTQARVSQVATAGKEKLHKKQELEQAAERARQLPPDARWHVEVADMRTWQTDERFDFVITDPPYPREYLPLYGALAQRALDWLKTGGLLFAMCGQSYLSEIIALMCEHLQYYWTGCYMTPGQAPHLYQKQVNTQWKPILIFGRPGEKYDGKPFGDMWMSGENDKDYHEWGQSVSGMFSLIQQVCRPGQTILDPFVGGGATGMAAIRHGCLFTGIDVDAKKVDTTRARLESAKCSTMFH